MEWGKSTNRHFIELMSSYLPDRIRQAVGLINGEYISQLEEIRIRKGLPLMGVFAGSDYFISEKGLLYDDPKIALIVSPREIESLFLLICEHSVYAFQNEITKGFITLKGGHRVGLCGTVVYEGEKIAAIKDISSVNIRFSRQIKGCAQDVFRHLMRNNNDIYNTLILSPPRLGKTTLLRDLCRIISQGVPNGKFNGLRTAVVDERSELAAIYRGVPQNDLGPRTDVMDGCRKSEGIEIMLRGMAPQVIIVDELGATQDAEAVRRAWNAGVRLIATAHSYGVEDFKCRLGVGKLIGREGFERVLLLGADKGKRWIKVMDANGNKLSFWIKIVGCMVVFAGCTAMGMTLSNRLAERQRLLSKLTEVLLNLKNQMCRLGNPLFFAFENIGKEGLAGNWSTILLDCGDMIKNQHIDTGEAWRLAIEKNKEAMPLEESDWAVISEFGEMLGKSDIQNQESVLELAKENIEILEKEAREAVKTKGKLYRNMGALSGAAVVILLL